MPDLNIPLQATVRAMDHLFSSQLSAFVRRHWSLPSQPLQGLEALLLGAATPARSPSDLAEGLDWGVNRFGPLLAQPSVAAWQGLLRRTMRQQLRRVLHRYHTGPVSPATRSRYRITLIWDTTTLLKVGQMLGWAAPFYSGMLHRPAHSIEVVLLYAVVGEDKQCLPMDFALRKPDPKGPGHPCKTALQQAQTMLVDLDNHLRIQHQSLRGHYLVADAWFADSDLLWTAYQRDLIPIVRGKTSFVFQDLQPLQTRSYPAAQLLVKNQGTWRRSRQAPDPYRRLSLYSHTFDFVTLTLFQRPHEPAPEYVLCLDPDVSSPRILRAYRRRPWIEACFEVCKATLNIERFKVRTQSASIYGFITLRLMGFALFDYAARRLLKGRWTAGQIIRKLHHHGTVWLRQLLDNSPLSQRLTHNP